MQATNVECTTQINVFYDKERIGDLNTLKRLIPAVEYQRVKAQILTGETSNSVACDRTRGQSIRYEVTFENKKNIEFCELEQKQRDAIIKNAEAGTIKTNVEFKERTTKVDELKKLINVKGEASR